MKIVLVFLFAIFFYTGSFAQVFCEGEDGFKFKVKDFGAFPTNYIPITTGWDEYDLFSDDFTSFNYSKWSKANNHCVPYCTHAYFSNSIQNVYTSGGKLYLKAKQLSIPQTCTDYEGSTNNYNYSSGYVYSNNTIRYGYIEIKCILPSNIALGPCFWLWNYIGDYNPPYAGYRYDEIDVFELYGPGMGYPIAKTLMQNIHHNLHDTLNTKSSLTQNIYFTNSFLNQDIIFAVEWLPEEMHFYVNGHLTKSVKFAEESTYRIHKNSDFTCTNYLNAIEQHMQITLGVNAMIWTYPDLSKAFEIDYIHSYKLVEGFNYEYWPTSFSISDPNMFKVHKSIRLGGTGKTAVIPTGQNITIWAEDGIILDKGFTVSGSTTFAAINIATTDLFNY